MAVHLFDNVIGAPTAGSNTSAGWEVGTRLSLVADAPCTQLAWYRFATGAGNAPTAVHLWDLSTHTLLENPAVPDNGSIGWQRVTLATARPLDATHTYAVSIVMPNGQSEGFWPNGSFSTAPAPFVGTGNLRCWQPGATTGEPTSNDNVLVWGVDVTLGAPTTPPDPADPVTAGNIANSLADWLSTVDGTKGSESAPLKTQALAVGATGFDAIKAVADAVAAAVSGLPGTIAGAVTTVTGQVTSSTADIFDHAVTGLVAIAGKLAEVDTRLIDIFAGLAGGASGALSGRSAFPTELWTLVDERDFENNLSWDVPADLYVVDVTTPNPMLGTADIDGATVAYRTGWWAIRNGDFFGERHYFDWSKAHLSDQGRRMPGVVVALLPPASAHIQAWSLT